MNADVAWLKDLYGSQGYVFADIQAEPIFLEEPGKIDLVYHIDEGKQWRVGHIFVHIDGDNPHTRDPDGAQSACRFRSGEIVDIREIHASERRLQASGLFLTDPVRGIMPKITYHIPEVGDTEMANGEGGSGFRGQSPDECREEQASMEHGVQLLPAPACRCQLIRRRSAAHRAAADSPTLRSSRPTAAAQAFKVELRPTPFLPSDDQTRRASVLRRRAASAAANAEGRPRVLEDAEYGVRVANSRSATKPAGRRTTTIASAASARTRLHQRGLSRPSYPTNQAANSCSTVPAPISA